MSLRYYADYYFEAGDSPGQPAFHTDIFPARDLQKLRRICECAAEEHPDLTYLILDEDLRVVDVFGKLWRKPASLEAIDWDEVYEQARATGDPPSPSVPSDA